MSDFELVVYDPDRPTEERVLGRFDGSFRDIARLSTRTIVDNIASNLDLSQPHQHVMVALRVDGLLESQSQYEVPPQLIGDDGVGHGHYVRQHLRAVLEGWRQ